MKQSERDDARPRRALGYRRVSATIVGSIQGSWVYGLAGSMTQLDALDPLQMAECGVAERWCQKTRNRTDTLGGILVRTGALIY